MLEVTEKASEMIKEALQGHKNPLSIRILLQGGWGGPSLGMALDESQESDVIFTDRGIQYLIDKELFDEVKPVTVDFMESFRGSGFQLTSSLSSRPGFGEGCSCWNVSNENFHALVVLALGYLAKSRIALAREWPERKD